MTQGTSAQAWAAPTVPPIRRRVEVNVHLAATELVTAFKTFSAAGLVSGAGDRHLVTQAQRHFAESEA
jgi:hypothetical protein